MPILTAWHVRSVMQVDPIGHALRYVAVAEAASRELANAETITAAETAVSRLREDALIEQLQAAKSAVNRAREMLSRAELDGDRDLIELVCRHLESKVFEYNSLYGVVRAELVEIKRAQINAHANVALLRQVLDTSCAAAIHAASQL
jgi:hypothetical protein